MVAGDLARLPRAWKRGVLLGEQRASKTRVQGSNPCAPALDPDSPSECDGRHAAPRRPQIRFDSWRGHSPGSCPRGVRDAHDLAKVEGQVRLLAGTLVQP